MHIDQRLAEEELQVEEVGELGARDERVGRTLAAGTGCPANSVDKHTGTGREVVVDDILEDRDVDTTGGDVGDDEDRRLAPAEALELLLARRLVERTIDV